MLRFGVMPHHASWGMPPAAYRRFAERAICMSFIFHMPLDILLEEPFRHCYYTRAVSWLLLRCLIILSPAERRHYTPAIIEI